MGRPKKNVALGGGGKHFIRMLNGLSNDFFKLFLESVMKKFAIGIYLCPAQYLNLIYTNPVWSDINDDINN